MSATSEPVEAAPSITAEYDWTSTWGMSAKGKKGEQRLRERNIEEPAPEPAPILEEPEPAPVADEQIEVPSASSETPIDDDVWGSFTSKNDKKKKKKSRPVVWDGGPAPAVECCVEEPAPASNEAVAECCVEEPTPASNEAVAECCVEEPTPASNEAVTECCVEEPNPASNEAVAECCVEEPTSASNQAVTECCVEEPAYVEDSIWNFWGTPSKEKKGKKVEEPLEAPVTNDEWDFWSAPSKKRKGKKAKKSLEPIAVDDEWSWGLPKKSEIPEPPPLEPAKEPAPLEDRSYDDAVPEADPTMPKEELTEPETVFEPSEEPQMPEVPREDLLQGSSVQDTGLCAFRARHLLEGDAWKDCEKCRALIHQVTIELARDGRSEDGFQIV